jgi:hypothetical protein
MRNPHFLTDLTFPVNLKAQSSLIILLRQFHNNFFCFVWWWWRSGGQGRSESRKKGLGGERHCYFVWSVGLDTVRREDGFYFDLSVHRGIPLASDIADKAIAPHSRPNLYSTLIGIVVANDAHLLFTKLDDAFLLKFLDSLDNSWLIWRVWDVLLLDRIVLRTEESWHMLNRCSESHIGVKSWRTYIIITRERSEDSCRCEFSK